MIKNVEAAMEVRWRGCSRRGTARRYGLMRSVPPKNRRDRLSDDEQIPDRRPRIHVLVVELHPVLERNIAAPVDLPQAGNALGNAQTTQRDCVVVRHFARQSGAGTDQRHIAKHYVDQVRQLVDTRAPEKTAERMKPRIVADLKDGAVDFVEVHDAVA